MKKLALTFFNFGLLLLAILGTNGNTIASFNQQMSREILAERQLLRYTQSAEFDRGTAIQSFDSLGITLHPGSTYKPESNGSPRSLNHCKSLVYRTLKSLPPEPVNHLRNLTLYFSSTGRRGLGGGDTVILRCQNVTDEELVSVLVHEMGHITDTGVVDGDRRSDRSGFMDGLKPVYEDDLSLEFYRLSWENDEDMKRSASKQDFVSGYAQTDPFEDFSESYTYYILHGKEFRAMAQENIILQSKYTFLKNRIFDGKEYQTGSDEIETTTRHFDVTVLPYDMKKFFVL